MREAFLSRAKMEADNERRGQQCKQQYADKQKAAKVKNWHKNQRHQVSKQLDLQERLERANLKIINMEKVVMELEAKNDKPKHVLEANRIG